MNHHVWDDFRQLFPDQFTIYTPDLPGFGESELLPSGFSIADVASALNHWARENSIENAVVAGHSLGGYVALEMVRQTPQPYSGMILFHSTALADSAEKKDSRSKVLQFIRDHGVLSFTSDFIEPLFHDPRNPAIESVRALCIQSGEDAVMGYTQAMRDRRDNSEVLQTFGKPVLLLGGEHDKAISAESLRQQADLDAGIRLEILPESAHMGMFEKKGEASSIILDFLSSVFPKS